MKRPPFNWPAPAPSEPKHWRSLDDLAQTPEFQEMVAREFPQGASELNSPLSRRSFMSLMGASMALAGMAGCRRPEDKILPYAKAPEGQVAGLPQYYATTMALGQQVLGLLVESHEGRPTKIEGNPLHPMSQGGTDVFAQASVLELYDPDRSTAPVVGGKAYDEAERLLGYEKVLLALRERREALAGAGGEGLHVLSGALTSPTLLRLRDQLLAAMPKAKWLVWEPINDDNARAGSRLAFGAGQDLHAQVDFERADVVLVLDGDPLGIDPGAVAGTRDFAARRRVEDRDDEMNRLYVVEPTYTVTGTNADHRLRLRPSEIAPFTLQLAAELAKAGVTLPQGIAEGLSKTTAKVPAAERFAAAVARDLAKAKTKAAIVAGARQPKEVHALVHALNAALGSVGTAVTYTRPIDAGRTLCADGIRELAQAIEGGKVSTLVILGGNPAYDAPADLRFAERLQSIKDKVIHLGHYQDETAKLAGIHIPKAHYLEAWSDAHAIDGTVSVVQPLIAPLFNGWSELELIHVLAAGRAAKGHDLVRETWRLAAAQATPANQAAPAAAPAQGKAPAAPAQGAAPGAMAPAAAVVVAAKAPAADAAKTPAAAAQAPVADAKGPAQAADAAKAPAPAADAKAPAAKGPGGAGAALAALPGTAAATAGPNALELAFDSAWRRILRDGLKVASAQPPVTPELNAAAVAAALPALLDTAGKEGMEISFQPDYSVYDGRFANNGWLQEFPDPITKLTWDNAALLSVHTAKELGVKNNDMVRIAVRGNTLDAAVYIQPGQADKVVSIALGYGRKTTGRIGKGAGFDAYKLRSSQALGFDTGISVAKAGTVYDDPRDNPAFDIDNPRDNSWLDTVHITGLVRTQDHFSQSEDEQWNFEPSYTSPGDGPVGRGKSKKGNGHGAAKPEGNNAGHAKPEGHGEGHGAGLAETANHHALEGRPLAREGSLAQFRKDPAFAKKMGHEPAKLQSIFDERPYVGQQWAMAIDLSACTGCGACVVACQAENNIPIVGKAQVRKGREMHWIRVDRYYSGDPTEPQTIHQPVPCMQCENAPCENVCPVAATVHSQDGLNDMVYNRCVGTRYCANNCPYKVRRFNFLNWRYYYERDAQQDVTPVAKLKYNPDVSLRARGVMEKCTYCVQRIRGAQRDATMKGQDRVADNVIVPACAQACPADAIVFGDLTDANTRVSKVRKSTRHYEMLAELNVKARTTYLARVRNLNPELHDHE
jgi:molybdopterin-containing oxidoreductase family iron-sulfur binding subunit